MDLQAEYATVVDYNAMLQTLRMASLNMQSQRRSVQQHRSVMVVTQQQQPVVTGRMATAQTQSIQQRTSARRPRAAEPLQVRSVRDLQMPSWAAKVGLHTAIPAISSATYVLQEDVVHHTGL